MINQIPFTEIDIKAIKHSVETSWPADGFKTRESFDDWLRKAHINLALRPFLWGLIAARHPDRYMCCWDIASVWEILQRERGQVVEARSVPSASNLSPDTIAEQIRQLLRLANRSRAIVIASAIVVVSTCNDLAAYEQITACTEVLQKYLPSTALLRSTVVIVGAREPQNVCLWISE